MNPFDRLNVDRLTDQLAAERSHNKRLRAREAVLVELLSMAPSRGAYDSWEAFGDAYFQWKQDTRKALATVSEE